jgi:hypothetical protein
MPWLHAKQRQAHCLLKGVVCLPQPFTIQAGQPKELPNLQPPTKLIHQVGQSRVI